MDTTEVLPQCPSGPDSASLRVNTGEYDALLGRSYYEIAAESRSQHKSQGFGVLQRKGVMWAYLSREASRVGPDDARSERSVFDGIDTTWTPLRAKLPTAVVPTLDSALAALAMVRGVYRADNPSALVTPLAAVLRQLRAVRNTLGSGPALLIGEGIDVRRRCARVLRSRQIPHCGMHCH